jgi:hypothetical protein
MTNIALVIKVKEQLQVLLHPVGSFQELPLTPLQEDPSQDVNVPGKNK